MIENNSKLVLRKPQVKKGRDSTERGYNKIGSNVIA